jgi:3-dehydrosphinganine reductase
MHAYAWFALAILSLLSAIYIGVMGVGQLEELAGVQVPFVCCNWVLVAPLVFLSIVLYVVAVIERPPKMKLKGKHVLVTGGSSGIGLATAIKCAKEEAVLTLVARNVQKLEDAKKKIESEVKGASVAVFSCDVCDGVKTKDVFAAAAKHHSRNIDVCVMSAGVSVPLHFEAYPDDEFDRVMKINYLGSIYSSRAAVPQMRENGGGRLVFVSSLGGLIGITGFTTYAPSKFAVRGLAEVLHMELQPHNIQVSLVNPADVNTPMYEEEMKSKPLACKMISEGSGLFEADAIAKDIVDAIEDWKFMVCTGFDATMVGILTSGAGPCASVGAALSQIFGMGIVRAYALGMLWSFNEITKTAWDIEQKKK